MALIASGQSIMVLGVASSAGVSADGVVIVCALVVAALGADLEADWAPRLAQQSWACIAAQASPVATMVSGLAGAPASPGAAALTMFSQPSKQPAPAIQKATASASTTRTILIEERKLILLLSLIKYPVAVEPEQAAWFNAMWSSNRRTTHWSWETSATRPALWEELRKSCGESSLRSG